MALHRKHTIQAGRRGSWGFSLLELLVVIAIICILAALLFPVLSRSRQRGQGTYCLNNLRQLQLAWAAYADDFQQRLILNRGMFRANPANLFDTWAAGDVADLPDETNVALLARSLLGPYAKNYSVYKCPADPGNPRGTARVRSVSMNNYMGGIGMDIFSNQLAYNARLQDIRRPANSFVFLDERASSINDGYSVVELTTNYSLLQPEDMPANYHVMAGSFSFSDGHAETKRWQSSYFARSPSTAGPGGLSNNPDYIWLMKNTTVPLDSDWP
ncbi:MAG: type II secretion system protein [Verrucomicrobiota bacterium]|jgi:prepilin-type N-terminal cleavage/methylation domain-containing protein